MVAWATGYRRYGIRQGGMRMRSLNSILIEGELSANPDWDRLRCVFTLRIAQQDFAGVITHFEIPGLKVPGTKISNNILTLFII